MNVLFITLFDIKSIDSHGIYEDLLREFSNKGHHIFVVSPSERRNRKKTYLIRKDNSVILKVKTGNIQKTNLIEKGIATVLLEPQYILAIKKYFADVKFDLVLYSTPPITLAGAVQYIKKRDGAKTYLLLKDIFPQNAVDIGMMSKTGIKGILYHYFRAKEKKLYALSDRIGCMSSANVDFLLKQNPEISAEKVEVCPNCIDPVDMSISNQEKFAMREKYGIPQDKKVFVYGGNLGKPQNVRFIVDCLKAADSMPDIYFVIAGSGTDKHFLEEYIENEHPRHVCLFGQMPRNEYDKMVACCDVGMIFLDYRFTIPNFPSRLLSYMQAGLPVLACTDKSTDIGQVIVSGGFGVWCESNDTKNVIESIMKLSGENLEEKRINSYQYLVEHYQIERAYETIVRTDHA